MTASRDRDRALPRYRAIAGEFAQAIRSGEYRPGSLLPSLSEMGQAYGVSEITVRNAVRVLAEDRLVTVVAGKGTVVLDPRDAPVPRPHERCVGILLPMLAQWAALFPALTDACHELGDAVLVRPLARDRHCAAEASAMAELEILRTTCRRGLLLYGERRLCEAFLAVRKPGEVGVCFSNSNGVPDELPQAGTDSFGGTFAVTRHLAALGHRRIAYLDDLFHRRRGDPRWSCGTTCERRYAGYAAALAAAGLRPSGIEEELCAWARGERLGSIRELFERPGAPTAVVCFNDAQAYRLWRLLHEAGVRVPEEVSLAGYDNARPPEWLPPGQALTTLDPNFAELARAAVRLVHEEGERLRSGRGRAPLLLVPSSLILRSSTAAPR